MDFLKNTAVKIWNWILTLFRTRYCVTVSYNAEWGDKDDRVYRNVRKIITKKEKLLSFIDENKNPVEIRGATGLNYKIEVENSMQKQSSRGRGPGLGLANCSPGFRGGGVIRCSICSPARLWGSRGRIWCLPGTLLGLQINANDLARSDPLHSLGSLWYNVLGVVSLFSPLLPLL